MSRRTVKLVLLALIVIDIILPVMIFVFPPLWPWLFHGVTHDDTLGLLQRLGAGWAAFCLWQIVAYLNWEREPGWLAVVAGIRLTEIWADWVYVYCADHATLLAWISLGMASPINALAGWYFWRAYRFYKCKSPCAPPPPPGPARAA
jgi:hypothetical protein